MIKAIQKRLAGDGGFTLIELMVVVMIIAVLIAIAIPSFLGFRSSAQDRSAQSDVRNVLLVEKAIWLETGDYVAGDAAGEADILAFEPSVVIGDGTTADATGGVLVTLNAASADIVCIEQTSDSGTAFGIWESSTAGTWYFEGETLLAGGCPAEVPAAADPAWTQSGW